MYYVYKTTNIVNNKIYIGVHKSDSIQNDEYIGSGKYLNIAILKYGRDKFKRQILYQFESKEKAYLMQSQIVDKQFVKRKDTYNIKLGGEGGGDHLRGTVTVKDKSGNTFQIDKNDSRYKSGQLVGNQKGFIIAKDPNGIIARVSKDDPRWLSGQLVGVAKGNILQGHQLGQKNSQYGTIWVTNGKQNKKIKKDNNIPQGWRRGRKLK